MQLRVSDDDNVWVYFSLDDITENKNTIFNVYENYQREWYDEGEDLVKCFDVNHRYVSSHKTKEGAEKYIKDRLEETASNLERITEALIDYQDNIENVAEDLVEIKMIRNNKKIFRKGDLELILPKYFVEEYELGDWNGGKWIDGDWKGGTWNDKKNPYPKKKTIEHPIITIDHNNITIHSHINNIGKMVLNKEEAALLYIELHKIISQTDNTNQKF